MQRVRFMEETQPEDKSIANRPAPPLARSRLLSRYKT